MALPPYCSRAMCRQTNLEEPMQGCAPPLQSAEPLRTLIERRDGNESALTAALESISELFRMPSEPYFAATGKAVEARCHSSHLSAQRVGIIIAVSEFDDDLITSHQDP